MSYDSMLFEDGGRQAKGATYENKTVGLNGDTETLIITSADTAFNTDIIGGGTAYVMGGTATQTLVDADDARLFVWGIDGNVGSAVGVSATNAGSVYVQSGAVINSAVITNRARLMIENSIGTNITCATGAQLHISSGAVVTGTEIMSGGSQIVSAGGTSKDLTVDKGGIVIFKGGEGQLGGKVNIYGSVKFLSNCTANLNGSAVTFHLEGRTASDTVFVDTPMENFTNGSFAITVSNSQEDGVYLLAKTTTAMPSFSSSISIVNMAGATIGTLKIDQTFTVASGTYSLAVKSVALDPRYPTKLSNVLCLTVTTTPGNVNWPSDWPNAPTTVKTAAAATSVILDSTYNTANGVAAVTASGTYGTITTNTASDFFVNIVAGSKIDKVIGYTQSNYLYLNGGNVRYLYGSYKNNNTGVNITVASGIVRFLVAAGQDLTVAGNVNITFTANADVTHTANIFGGAIAIDKSSEVTGQITLSLTDANFNGLIFGGCRAQNAGITASANGIVINATGITQTPNHKGITSGTTNWIVGGGQALNGATVTAASVTINAVDSKLGQIVGGAEAKGSGAVGKVDNVAITLSGTTQVDTIYVGGYADEGGKSIVSNASLTINSSSSSSATNNITITGNIFGAANPHNTGNSIVENLEITFTGLGDNLSFSGVVDAVGKTNNSVTNSTLCFSAFSGEFSAKIKNFDTLKFAGNSAVDLVNGTATADSFKFDFSGRTSANYGTALADMDFKVGETSTLAVDLTTNQLRSSNTFALIEVGTDTTILGCSTIIYQDGISLGEVMFGETLTVDQKGTFATRIDETGKAVITFTKL